MKRKANKENNIALCYFGDNCIAFESFTATIGDLIVANWTYVIVCIDVYCHIIDKMT